jgi:dimeric dUTPase (all-alpha-NTP-PPase superfamily)
MEKVKEMFNMQSRLNTMTNGEDWKSGETSESRNINFYRCIYMEAAEAIDSFNWKHWKDIESDHDWDNAIVEVIDIWHFLMSAILMEGKIDLVRDLEFRTPVKEPNSNLLIAHLEKIISQSIASIDTEDTNIKEILATFLDILSESGVSGDALYIKYIAKNQLNIFRQDHGYKEGTYIKVWDAVEDNVIAQKLMEQHPEFTANQLYKELQREYLHLEENQRHGDHKCEFEEGCEDDVPEDSISDEVVEN